MISLGMNVIILILEVVSLIKLRHVRKYKLLAFYTFLSNMVAAWAAIVFIVMGYDMPSTMICRYLATCMLTLTGLVAAFVLIPLGEDPKSVLWKGTGFIHHVAVPILSLVSYILFENSPKQRYVLVPICVTIVYGLIMVILNIIGKYDGPYPFLKVRKQSVLTSVLWICAIVVGFSLLSLILIKL